MKQKYTFIWYNPTNKHLDCLENMESCTWRTSVWSPGRITGNFGSTFSLFFVMWCCLHPAARKSACLSLNGVQIIVGNVLKFQPIEERIVFRVGNVSWIGIKIMMTQTLIKPMNFKSNAHLRLSSASKRGQFDQIPWYHVVYPKWVTWYKIQFLGSWWVILVPIILL